MPRAERAALPAFTPVPRKSARHDGWTPQRQRAFIEALADTGSVSRACAMVNMTTVGAYYLRRQPGADEFRRAWEAALDYGVARMKDIAFERAVEGTLAPVITGGKLIGWRRIYNDRLLMFCLRHYGEDANGKRTRVEYFSTRAVAGASSAPSAATPTPGGAIASAEASTTTVRTTIASQAAPEELAAALGETAATLDGFAGIELDVQAQAEIRAVLEQCAARRRALEGTADDEAQPFIAALQPPQEMLVRDEGYSKPRRVRGRPPPAYGIAVEPEEILESRPVDLIQTDEQYRSDAQEMDWRLLDDEDSMRAIEEAVSQVVRGTTEERLGESVVRRAQESDCEAITNQRAAQATRSAGGTSSKRAANAGQPAPQGDRTNVTAEPPKVPATRSIAGKATEVSLRDGTTSSNPRPKKRTRK